MLSPTLATDYDRVLASGANALSTAWGIESWIVIVAPPLIAIACFSVWLAWAYATGPKF